MILKQQHSWPLQPTPSTGENILRSLIKSMFNITHFRCNRREQLYKPNYHQLMIGREDSLHEAAHSIDVGTRVFVHGSLKTYVQPANDGTKKLVYFIKPNKLLVTQESRDDRAGDDALDNM